MTLRVVVFLLVLGGNFPTAHALEAFKEEYPYQLEPLTKNGLLGRWEGTGQGTGLGLDSWYRMDLFPGAGYLVILTRGRRDLFKLEKLNFTGRNKVSLRFRKISGPPLRFPVILSVDAIGHTFQDTVGELNATMVQSLSEAHWILKAYLQKGKGPSQDVFDMLKDADRMIRDAKRKRL